MAGMGRIADWPVWSDEVRFLQYIQLCSSGLGHSRTFADFRKQTSDRSRTGSASQHLSICRDFINSKDPDPLLAEMPFDDGPVAFVMVQGARG